MKEETKKIIRLAASGVLFALGLILDKTVGLGYYSLLFYIPAYLIAGYDVLWRAVKNLVRGRALDENLLMMVATVGAFAVGDFPEGAAVMLFYQVGELFNDMAGGKTPAAAFPRCCPCARIPHAFCARTERRKRWTPTM